MIQHVASLCLVVVAASLLIAVVLGIQPMIARDSAGNPLFFPLPLSVTIPALVGAHILFFGVIEGIFTILAIRFIGRLRPDGLLREETG